MSVFFFVLFWGMNVRFPRPADGDRRSSHATYRLRLVVNVSVEIKPPFVLEFTVENVAVGNGYLSITWCSIAVRYGSYPYFFLIIGQNNTVLTQRDKESHVGSCREKNRLERLLLQRNNPIAPVVSRDISSCLRT